MSATPGEVLFFSSIDEYRCRPNYLATLILGEGEVDRIIGKYELPADRSFWADCGLNNCNTAHRFGYVICAKDGRETNIGHECGARELGVSFREVEATFKRAEDMQARRRAIENLLAEQATLRQRALMAIRDGNLQAARLSAFQKSLSHLHGFWRELIKAAKLGGLVRAPVKQEGNFGLGGGKEQLATVARLEGTAVLTNDSPGTPKLVEQLVLPWVESLSSESLSTMSQDGFAQTLKHAERMTSLLQRAEDFVITSRALLTATNVLGLHAICDHVLRHTDAGYARPYLDAWIKAAEVAVPTSPVKLPRSPR